MRSWISRNSVRDKMLIKARGLVLDTWQFSYARRNEPWGLWYIPCATDTWVSSEGSRNASLVAHFVVQSTSVAERTPKGKFPQLLPAACCTLLRVTFWTPKNQGSFGGVCSGVGIFLRVSSPLGSWFSKCWKQRNKVLRVSESKYREGSGHIKKKNHSAGSLQKNLKEALT